MIDLALIIQLLVFLTITGVFLARGTASLFHPLTMYLGFHGLVFVVRPALVHWFHYDMIWNYMGFEPTEGVFIRTLAVSSVALLVFALSCHLTAGKASLFPTSTATAASLPGRRSLWITSILLLPVIAWSVYATRNGVTGERFGAVFIHTESVGYLNDAQFMIAPLLCAALAATRFHWLNLLPVSLYVGYRSWCGWSRWTIVLFLIMVALTYCWQRRIRWLPAWVLPAAIPMLLLFNLLGQNREILRGFLGGQDLQDLTYAPGMSSQQKLKKRLDTLDFGNFDFLAYIVAVVPERTGEYTYGLQYVQLFTEPIPRKLWKGKPVGSPVRLINLNAYGNFIGLTYSLPGDGWMSGGWVGLCVTMALVGAILGRAHSFFWRHVQRPAIAILYLAGLAMLPQWFRDGSIAIAKFLFWTWLPLLLWLAVDWLLGQRLVRAYSFVLPQGARLRFLRIPHGSSPAGPVSSVS